MYLDCHQSQTVYFRGLDVTVEFTAGESIRTEISRKFNLDQLQNYLLQQGLKTLKVWGDRRDYFSLILTQAI